MEVSDKKIVMKKLHRLTIIALRAASSFTSGVLSAQRAAFGLTTTQTTALDTAVTNFDSAINDVIAAKAALKSAVEAQDAARTSVLEALSNCAATIYNNSAVTDTMIASAGYEPRDTNRSKQFPFTPTDVIATPFANGNVELKWNKGQNTYGSVYVIEARFGEGDWAVVYQTTKSKVTLTGFNPGDLAWFRISAIRNEESSAPTEEVVIYAPTPEATTLRAAA